MQPATEFNSLTVEERPGEQLVTIRGKFGDREDIKIEATMFDGYEHIPVDDSSAVNVRLHLSLLVDISKGDGGNVLEFVCSAWPDCLDVEKVYILRHGQMPARPYLGPDFRFDLHFHLYLLLYLLLVWPRRIELNFSILLMSLMVKSFLFTFQLCKPEFSYTKLIIKP